MRNEYAKLFEGQPGSTPATPTKRKASREDEEKKTPPSKRVRKPKREKLDGVPFSDISDSPAEEVKAEEAAVNALDLFQSYNAPFMPADYFVPVNSQIRGGERSGNHSFIG